VNYLLFGGAPDVGKTKAIKRLEQYFIKQKHFGKTKRQRLVDGDFYACIDGVNNAGKEIRVLISSTADDSETIDGFKSFRDKHQPCDFIVSAIRDEGDPDRMRDYFYNTMIEPGVDYVFEIPMGKITHRNLQKRNDAVKWYSERIDTLAHTILQHTPFFI
jgi:hypothetical protein